MPAGGYVKNAGSPTIHSRQIKKEGKASAAAIEQEILHPRYADLIEAALYKALGTKAPGCKRCKKIIASCKCVKPDKGEVYEVEPNMTMLTLLIEKVGGRSTQAPQVQADTSIVVVPRFERPPMPGVKTVTSDELEVTSEDEEATEPLDDYMRAGAPARAPAPAFTDIEDDEE